MAENKRSFVRMIRGWSRAVLVEHIVSLRDTLTQQGEELSRLQKLAVDQDVCHRARIDECRVAAAGMRRQIEQAGDAQAAAVTAVREALEREVGDLKVELDRRIREHAHALNEKDKCIVRLSGVADGLELAMAIAIGDGT